MVDSRVVAAVRRVVAAARAEGLIAVGSSLELGLALELAPAADSASVAAGGLSVRDFPLRLARHPSENDARMMVRLLAFMMFADERLEFGKGLSTDEEPDLWHKDMTGSIDLWILVGQPDERWLRKASGRSRQVVVISYGDRVADVWWEQNRKTLEKISNLTIYQLGAEDTQALAAVATRARCCGANCGRAIARKTSSEIARGKLGGVRGRRPQTGWNRGNPR